LVKCARARCAQADRLADVQRAAVGVAEDVDAGVLREPLESRALAARALAPGALGAARARPSSASASPTVRACAHRRANSAQSTRAHVSASGQRAVDGADLDPERVGERASPRARCSGASRRASATVHSTGGSGQSSAARSNAWRSTRASKRALWATSTRPRSARASSGSTPRAAARRRPSPA
jgi:hypothetical protein